MKPLRVLIFSATFGAGHVRAAEALISALKDKEPGAEIIHLDAFAIINKKLNEVIRNSYIKILRKAPKIWGKIYNNTKELSEKSIFNWFNNTLGRRQFVYYIKSLNPDIIVCTYPIVAGVLAELRIKGKLDIPLVSVVTDYSVHNQWIHQGVDLNLVGNQYVYQGFIERGIKPDQVLVTGIPVNPNFELKIKPEEIRKKLGLMEDRFTFLIMGGAYCFLDKAEWICSYLANIEANVQVMLVCGTDKELYRSLDSLAEKARNPVLRFGFVNNVEELMSAADVLITKAGGLTVAEALTKNLPIIVYNTLPGQEENNALYVQEIGAGRIAKTDKQLIDIINSLMADPLLIKKMRADAARESHAYSADKAVQAILDLIADSPSKGEDSPDKLLAAN